MIPVILYYSLGGKTRAEAEKQAAATGADLFEIVEVKKRGILSAYLIGCPMALGRSASKIRPLDIEWALYDTVMLMSPVWAGNPAPAFNAALEIIPKDKVLHVTLCSAGGETPKSKEATISMLRSQGFALASYSDVLTGTLKK